MVKGLKDMCEAMDVFIIGEDFPHHFQILYCYGVAVIGKLVTDKPLTNRQRQRGIK